MTMRKELLDELLKDYKKPEDLIGENGHISNRAIYFALGVTMEGEKRVAWDVGIAK